MTKNKKPERGELSYWIFIEKDYTKLVRGDEAVLDYVIQRLQEKGVEVSNAD